MKKLVLAGMVSMVASTASAGVGDVLKRAANTVGYGALCGFSASMTGCEKFDGVDRMKTLNYHFRDTWLRMIPKNQRYDNCVEAGFDKACRHMGIVPEGE